MGKEDVVYIHNGILLGIKKNEILPFVTTWLDLEDITLSEVSHSEKGKYYVISFICVIEETKSMNKRKRS